MQGKSDRAGAAVMTKNGEYRATQVNAPRIFLLFFLPVLVFWFINFITPMFFINFDMNNLRVSVGKAYSKDNLARTGTFGDTFGAVNSLFSGLAFAGVAVGNGRVKLTHPERVKLTHLGLQNSRSGQER
jgi:hypothetical protein